MDARAPSQAAFPAKLRFLFEPHRYKVAHGGRGSAKTWSFARALLIEGTKRRLRILCCREIQKSIAESVHTVLKEQIEELGLGYFYTVTKTGIYSHVNGTEFLFAGLWMNVDSIKSKEGIDVVWVEEAHGVSEDSWKKLIPTIRKDGSEIWVTFNPELDTDPTYLRFIKSPPEEAMVVEVNWRDNPWFPSVLKAEMRHDRQRDEDDYLWTWEGKTRQFLTGSVYAKELRRVVKEGRIREVKYDERSAVNVFMDLGWSDLMTAWFIQKVGIEYRALGYWQGRHVRVSEFWKDVIKGDDEKYAHHKEWNFGTVFLPHDADHGQLASDGGTVEDLFKAQGATTQVLPRIPSEHFGIEKVRAIIPSVWFDETACADGITSLRRYRYGVDEKTKEYTRQPLHDMASHGAKGFEGFALSVGMDYTKVTSTLKVPTIQPPQGRGLGWMGR